MPQRLASPCRGLIRRCRQARRPAQRFEPSSPDERKLFGAKKETGLSGSPNRLGCPCEFVLSLDTPIFDSRERESLETNQCVQPYTLIAKRQLVGLLGALGEYEARVAPALGAFIRRFSNDPELPEMCRTLVIFCRRPRNTSIAASSGHWVFDALERSTLSKHKYIRGTEDLTKQQLIGLLETLGRYPLHAPRIEQVFWQPRMRFTSALPQANKNSGFNCSFPYGPPEGSVLCHATTAGCVLPEGLAQLLEISIFE